jgi:hypothetical protein
MNVRRTTRDVTTNKYYYDGPLGDVIRHGLSFSTWKDHSILIGSYKTFDEAIVALQREAEYPTH